MKYYSPTLQHRVRSLRPRLRVPTHWPTTPPCSADPFPVCSRDLDSTPAHTGLARRRSFPLPLQPPQGPLNSIQNP